MSDLGAPPAQVFLAREDAWRATAGYLIGWNPHSFVCTIAAVEGGAPLAVLDEALRILAMEPALQPLISHCGGPPGVLGVWLPASGAGSDGDFRFSAAERAQSAELWLTLCGLPEGSGTPQLRDVHCCGCRHRAPLQLILFRRASRSGEVSSQFSLHAPWEADRMEVDDDARSTGVRSFDDDATTEASCGGRSRATVGMSSLEQTLRQVSCSGIFQHAIAIALAHPARTAHRSDGALLSAAAKRLLAALVVGGGGGGSGSDDGDESAQTERATPGEAVGMAASGRGTQQRTAVSWPVHAVWRCAGRAIGHVARGWLWLLCAEAVGGHSLRRWLRSARQSEARLRVVLEWRGRWRALRGRPRWHASVVVERMHAYGELTSCVVDAALGVAVAVALWRWRDVLCERAFTVVAAFHEAWLPGRVRWLMGVDPGGFKLNENLNRYLGQATLALLRAWHDALALILSSLPPPQSLLVLCLPGCCLGASVGVALASDALTLSSLHLHVLYRATAALYSGYLAALGCLFNLFRGKKYNVLRARVDSCNYDAEVLLLGTLLFTTLVFLLPTLLAYYVLAATLHIAVGLAQALLMGLLMGLDDFPWYELTLWFLAPRSLQAGVRFRPLAPTAALRPPPRPADSARRPGSSYVCGGRDGSASSRDATAGGANFALEPQPASLAPLFSRHARVVRALAAHYALSYVLRCLLLGRVVRPVDGPAVLLRPSRPRPRARHQ